MNKYRMKPLQNLEKYEQQVKMGVRQKIAAGEMKKHKAYVPQLIGVVATLTLAALLFFMVNSSEKTPLDTTSQPNPSLNSEVQFALTEVNIGTLAAREEYYIATSLSWSGPEDDQLMSLDFIDGDGNVIDYNQHHIAFQVYTTKQILKPGVYTKQDIDFLKLEVFSPANFKPNSDNKILIELRVNSSFVPQDDFYVKLNFATGKVHLMDWKSLATLNVEPVDYSAILESLNLTAEELSAYETFKESRDQNALRDLTPLSVARLYLVAEIEGLSELQHAFYILDPQYITSSYEELQKDYSPFHEQPLSELIQLFEDLSSGTFIESTYGGYISFFREDPTIPSIFQMIRNSEGIWQVAFTPLQ